MAKPQGIEFKNKANYKLFIQWFISPNDERAEDEQSLKEFSDKHQIPLRNLYNWQKRQYFINTIDKHFDDLRRANRVNVVKTLVAGVKKHDVKMTQLYLEYIEGWSKTIKNEHSGEISINADELAKKRLEMDNDDNSK